MITRIAILAALLATGGAISFAQIDRTSREEPSLSLLVPSIFSAEASRTRAYAAVQAGLGEQAMTEARTQLRLRPMPAESLSLMFVAASSHGETEIALAALNAASRRGWREPLSQLASGQSALRRGNHDIAAQRIVALLSTGRLSEQAMALLDELLQTTAGREAFAKRLIEHGLWQNGLLVSAPEALEPRTWLATLEKAEETGFAPNCDLLIEAQRRYAVKGLDFEIEKFLDGRCGLGR